MKNSLLITIISQLNKRTFDRFILFVQSPFFNKNEKIRDLVLFLQKFHPDFEMLDKGRVHNHIFRNRAYNNNKLNNLLYEATRLVEEFLVQIGLEKKTNTKKLYLLRQARELKLDKYFERILKKTQKEVAKQAQGEDFFYDSFRLAAECDYFYASKRSQQMAISLKQKVHALDKYYIISKLHDYCEMLNRQKIIKVSYEMPLLPELVAYLQSPNSSYKDCNIINIYLHLLLMLSHSDEEIHYHQFFDALEKNTEQLHPRLAQALFRHAQNYCIRKIHTGQGIYLRKLFTVFQKSLEYGVLLDEKGFLLEWDYKNIVTVGLRLQEFDWTEQFIEAYKQRLPSEQAENAYTYNLAYLYYSQQKYNLAKETLLTVVFTDKLYYHGNKKLLLKIYYETNETQALYSLIDAFKTYLLRSKILSKQQQLSSQNLVRFTKKAYKIKSEYHLWPIDKQKQQVSRLKSDMQQVRQIAEANWLWACVDELEKTILNKQFS